MRAGTGETSPPGAHDRESQLDPADAEAGAIAAAARPLLAGWIPSLRPNGHSDATSALAERSEMLEMLDDSAALGVLLALDECKMHRHAAVETTHLLAGSLRASSALWSAWTTLVDPDQFLDELLRSNARQPPAVGPSGQTKPRLRPRDTSALRRRPLVDVWTMVRYAYSRNRPILAPPSRDALARAVKLARRLGADRAAAEHVVLSMLLDPVDAPGPLTSALDPKSHAGRTLTRLGVPEPDTRLWLARQVAPGRVQRELTAPAGIPVARSAARWWAHVPAVHAQIECAGQTHTIRWRSGKLVAENHSLRAEEALKRLGVGRVDECVRIVDAWRACFTSPNLQIVLGTSFGQSVADHARRRGSPTSRLETAIRQMPPSLRWALALALAHPGPGSTAQAARLDLRAPRRTHPIQPIAAALVTGLASHLASGDAGTGLLERHSRSARSVGTRQSGHWARVQSDVASIVLRHASAGPVSVGGEYRDGKIDAEITFAPGWPRHVFARGLALEHLVTEVTGESQDYATVRVNAARWEPDGAGHVIRVRPAEMTLQSPGIWHTRWLDGAT